MNGMQAKAERKHLQQLAVDGILIHGNDWTEDDWRDLHRAIESIKARLRARHRDQIKARTRLPATD